jgi:cytochrome c biogenesis protein CcmG, thiol:disulfide interchange protein DsbE
LPPTSTRIGSLPYPERRLELPSRLEHKTAVRTILLSWVCCGSLLTLVHAADQRFDTLRAGSQVFSNVTVISSTPTVLYIQHARGVGSVKLKDLSPDLQQKFGYDPTKAAAVEALQKQAQVDYVKTLTNQPKPKAGSETVTKLYAKSLMGQPGPAIVIDKWLGDPADVTDKFVLLEFWATWSEPCLKVIPHLNDLHRRYGDKVAVLALSDEPEADVRKLTDPKIEFFSAIDTQRRTVQAVEVTGIPHALLMDPKGVVRFQGLPTDLTEEKLDKLLDAFVP